MGSNQQPSDQKSSTLPLFYTVCNLMLNIYTLISYIHLPFISTFYLIVLSIFTFYHACYVQFMFSPHIHVYMGIKSGIYDQLIPDISYFTMSSSILGYLKVFSRLFHSTFSNFIAT